MTGPAPSCACGKPRSDHPHDACDVKPHDAPRYNRRKGGYRTRSISRKRIAALVAENRGPRTDHARPQTRLECVDGPRPCPWVACRHHLYLEVNPNSGSIIMNFPDKEPDELEHSCSLDEASEPRTLDEVGERLNLTRERIRQQEIDLVGRLAKRMARMV